jgi:hypothetical protein
LNLCLFDGAAGGAGAAGAAPGGEGAGAGENGQEAAAPVNPRAKRNPLANVKYGIQPEAAPQAAAATEETAPVQEQRKTFQELVDGEYKQDADKYVQSILKKRLGESKAAEAKLGELAPVFELLGQKYGIDTTDMAKLDVKALAQKLSEDDSLYEAESEKRGLPLDVTKTIVQLEKRVEAADRMQQNMMFNQHFQKLATEGEALKAIYPGFDLMHEMDNPKFQRLTSPNVGISVRDAYELIHKDDIQAATMQYAVQKSAEKLAQSVQANAARPAENGSTQNSVTVKTDPRTFSKQDRDEIRRRVRLGEKIVF